MKYTALTWCIFDTIVLDAQEMTKKKLKGKGDEEAHGILEGISSLHSWIKTQTMIRPTKLGKKKDDSFDDVSDVDNNATVTKWEL